MTLGSQEVNSHLCFNPYSVLTTSPAWLVVNVDGCTKQDKQLKICTSTGWRHMSNSTGPFIRKFGKAYKTSHDTNWWSAAIGTDDINQIVSSFDESKIDCTMTSRHHLKLHCSRTLELEQWQPSLSWKQLVSDSDPMRAVLVVYLRENMHPVDGEKISFLTYLSSTILTQHRVSPRWLLTSESGWCSRLLHPSPLQDPILAGPPHCWPVSMWLYTDWIYQTQAVQ